MAWPETGPGFVQVPVLARRGTPVWTHHGGQLRCRNLAVDCRGGPHTSAKRACFVDLIVPTLSKPIGVSVTKAGNVCWLFPRVSVLTSLRRGQTILGVPPAGWLAQWSRAALESSGNKGHEHAGPWGVGAVSISLLDSHSTRHKPDYDGKLTGRVQEAQSYTEKTAVKRVA